MGRDKANLSLAGSPVLASLVTRLMPLCVGGVMVIKRADQDLPELPETCRVEEDVFEDCGALGGLHTALTRAQTPWVFAAACDMPLLSPELVAWMRDYLPVEQQAVIPVRDGFLEPLHALYSVDCLEPVEAALRSGRRRMDSWLDSVRVERIEENNWRAVHPSGDSFLNVNRPTDLERVVDAVSKR
jgi:molybdopterin-guanine dinucleotide biosynthesis protein A